MKPRTLSWRAQVRAARVRAARRRRAREREIARLRQRRLDRRKQPIYLADVALLPVWHRDRLVAYALVDHRDARRLAGVKWHRTESAPGCYYARGSVPMHNVPMHRAVLGPAVYATAARRFRCPWQIHTDHVNWNGLDNRRANVRVVPPLVNMRNPHPGRRDPARRRFVWPK